MESLFLWYLRAGLLGSCLILVVLALRLLLKKAPRSIVCLFWVAVVIRLLLPFQIESRLSLQPVEILDAVPVQSQQYHVYLDTPSVSGEQAEKGTFSAVKLMSILWLCGTGGMLLYAADSYRYWRKKVLKNAKKFDGVWLNGEIENAFLLGYFRPQIVLPAGLQGEQREFVMAHEKAHLARGDHWWKLLGYIGLAVHWYNPVVWLGYIMMSRDIEYACDQMVIRNMDLQSRKGYSITLLNSSRIGLGYTSIPVSFAEVSLKKRIIHVLHYKKPAIWISCVAVLAVVLAAVCFLTIPEQPEEGGSAAATQPSLEHLESADASEPITEPVTEPITEPITEPVTEPITEPITEPVTEPITEPVTESVTEAATQPPVEPLPTDPVEEETEVYDPHNLIPFDQKITAYAAASGFQTMDSYPNTDVKYFSVQMVPKFGDSRFEQEFYSAGCRAVDKAYQYCKENNAMVENSLVWVEISYSAVVGYCNIRVYCAAAY